ncbi:HTH-type transcriptional activator CmpR [Hartmannibacter diazotrophicus]|uniref:HTH-type transcriptional regulator CbbR n=1 Tax=Hartmannibacter diazotrophicus TaxID=1482074 RepID=A0A2C9D6H8_9HYPH|nr:LysR substrate-binding domain-containing protein [Hartmannibacter diazotrophicus]SON55748.1 HTH-type transcriptional activator CmpR [Hartmannibacter diazotrophicus]
MRHVTLKQLRCLAAVISTGSVTKAASVMNVTPPAITAQIKSLEDQVGLAVVERISERFEATPAGAEIAETLTKIETLLAECSDALAELKDAGAGKVSVGIISTARYFAPFAIAAFQKTRPRVSINLMVGNRERTLTALRGYEIDLAIMGRPPRDFDVEADVIGDHPLVMIAPPDHPLAGKRGITLADLGDETFLVRENGSGTRYAFEGFLSAKTDLMKYRSLEMNSNETIKQAVMAGLGIAFISGHTVSVEVQAGRLTLLDVEGLPVQRKWFLVRRTDKRLLPAANALWDFWVSEGATFLPELPLMEDLLQD